MKGEVEAIEVCAEKCQRSKPSFSRPGAFGLAHFHKLCIAEANVNAGISNSGATNPPPPSDIDTWSFLSSAHGKTQ